MTPRPYLFRFPADGVPSAIAEAVGGMGDLTPMNPREYLLVLSYERHAAELARLRTEWETNGLVKIEPFPAGL